MNKNKSFINMLDNKGPEIVRWGNPLVCNLYFALDFSRKNITRLGIPVVKS